MFRRKANKQPHLPPNRVTQVRFLNNSRNTAGKEWRRKFRLYNKASIGPKDYQLRVGDILHVKEDVQLVEGKYDGEAYTAYKIVWDYKN